jgi:hypothetical protein
MTVFALLGAKALWLTYIWLASAIISSWLSNRKGYGEKPGLACGLLLTALGVVIWLIVPAREDSRWKVQGPIPRRGAQTQTVAEARARRHEQEHGES